MTNIKDMQAISRQSRRAVLRIMIQSEVQSRRNMVAYVSRRDFWARLLFLGLITYGNAHAGVVCSHLGCGVGIHSVSFSSCW